MHVCIFFKKGHNDENLRRCHPLLTRMLTSVIDVMPGQRRCYVWKIKDIIWYYNKFLNVFGRYNTIRKKYFLSEGLYFDLFKGCKFDNPVDALFYLSYDV